MEQGCASLFLISELLTLLILQEYLSNRRDGSYNQIPYLRDARVRLESRKGWLLFESANLAPRQRNSLIGYEMNTQKQK